MLKNGQKIIIGNLTYESIELASTIKEHYPNSQINIVDYNDKNYLERDMHKKVFQEIRNRFQKEGIKFYLQKNLDNLDIKVEGEKMMGIKFPTGEFIPSDFMYLFENEPLYSFLDNYKEGMSLNVIPNTFQVPTNYGQ